MELGSWTTRKKLGVGAMVLAGAAAICSGSYYTWLTTPPPLPKTPEQVINLVQSPRYKRLPDYRKGEYLDHGRRLVREIPDEQRAELFARVRNNPSLRQAMREVHHHAMVQRALAFAQATPEVRTQLLDEQMDRMGQRQASRETRRSTSPDGPNRDRRRGRFREHIQDRFETGNPQINALIGEYFRALRERREQRE